MARIVARNAAILCGGRDLSARSNSAALSITSEAPEVTTFTESTRTRLPGGLGDVELTVDGFWDSAASQVDETFSTLIGASDWWGFYPAGTTACNYGREWQGILTEYGSNAAVADALTTSVTVAGSPPLLYTRVLAGGTLVGTGLGSSGVGSSAVGAGVDYGAATTCPVYGIMRVFSLTGTSPEIAGSLQQSTNDSTWTTLAVFYAAGAAASSGSIVNVQTATSSARYRRFRYVVGASGLNSASVVTAVTSGSVLFV